VLFVVEEKELKDQRPWLERLAGKSESLFNYALFELPSGYGLAPGRALWGLLGLIPIFALPYWIALKRANSRSGIWMIVPADRLARGRGKEKAVLIRPQTAKTRRGRLMDEFRLFRTSLYFSLLSTFHPYWLARVQCWILDGPHAAPRIHPACHRLGPHGKPRQNILYTRAEINRLYSAPECLMYSLPDGGEILSTTYCL
jgi:hypothetical protein